MKKKEIQHNPIHTQLSRNDMVAASTQCSWSVINMVFQRNVLPMGSRFRLLCLQLVNMELYIVCKILQNIMCVNFSRFVQVCMSGVFYFSEEARYTHFALVLLLLLLCIKFDNNSFFPRHTLGCWAYSFCASFRLT